VGSANDKYELTLIARNIFDKEFKTGAGTYGGRGAITEQPGLGRTIGLAFRAKI
jgi:iron complex outermembrane receptor protein